MLLQYPHKTRAPGTVPRVVAYRSRGPKKAERYYDAGKREYYRENMLFAYRMLFHRHYGADASPRAFVKKIRDPQSGLDRFFMNEGSFRFVEISYPGKTLLPQGEFMRRMKDQQRMGGGGGMAMMGNLPDSYDLVFNANHPLVLGWSEQKPADREASVRRSIDLARLSQGLLSGEELTRFISGGYEALSPATKKPVAKKPVAKKPAAKKPVAEKAAAKKPAKKK